MNCIDFCSSFLRTDIRLICFFVFLSYLCASPHNNNYLQNAERCRAIFRTNGYKRLAAEKMNEQASI